MVKHYLTLICFFVFILFFSSQKVHASTLNIYFNELMWMGGKSSADEWIELHNPNSMPADISNWQITYLSSGVEKLMLTIPNGKNIPAKSYFLISNYAKGDKSTLATTPDFVDTSVSLSNDTLQIKLYSGDFTDSSLLVDVAGNSKTPLAGKNTATEKSSMERKSDYKDGSMASSWQTAMQSVNLLALDNIVQNGTPGVANSIKEEPPIPLASTDLEAEVVGLNSIQFLWQNTDTQTLTFTLRIWQKEDMSDVQEIADLTKKSYLFEDLDFGTYYWQVLAANDFDETASDDATIELLAPVYSDKIVINELMPDPSGDDAANEWIELFNNSAEIVSLKDWILEDTNGATHKYKIGNISIDPFSYLVLKRNQTSITLNNDRDGVRLYQPNGNFISETSIFIDAKQDFAWARASLNDWVWTIRPTEKTKNIIELPPNNAGGDEEDLPVINKIPIKIKTKNFKSYKNKLVQVEGEVVETSGRTFYLNDGSGKAKIYVQTQTEIKKPPMHKGDIFRVVGVVNIYRNTWRILPRVQEDILLIRTKNRTKTLTTAKKASTTKKMVVSKTVKSSPEKARAPTLESLIKEVKAATNQAQQKTSSDKTPWWLQLIKLITGLAVVFVILLFLKIRTMPRIKIVGGRFGQDDT